MCCDWLDVLIVAGVAFALGCLSAGFVMRAALREQAKEQQNLHARTSLKDRQCRYL